MQALCCPECFGDQGLREVIIPKRKQTHGQCAYCLSQDVDLIDPRNLADEFELLASVYKDDPNGKTLFEWMSADWRLFPKIESIKAIKLLADIFDDGDIARKTFSPSLADKSDGVGRWATLREELMYKNRYFLDEVLDQDRLRFLLSYLEVFLPEGDLPKQWYRARIKSGEHIFSFGEMGAPPKNLATHGRANPTGIPYLYLGSVVETAVAEIRPHTGEDVCIAKFTIDKRIKVVDLRSPRTLVHQKMSPFIDLQESSAIGQMRGDILFLERLGSELTRPVLPRSAAIDYLPSQYLCEFIKKSGYDGVLYSSSVSAGVNLALFDPSNAFASDVSLYTVDRVSVDVSPTK